jgi:hypothetical protein
MTKAGIEAKSEKKDVKETKAKAISEVLDSERGMNMMTLVRNLKNIIETAPDKVDDAIEQLTKSGITQSAGELSTAGGAGISYLVSRGLQTQGIGEFVGKVSGTAANPKKEQLFRNVDFRTFSFNYQFFPRSKEEAQKVQAIIKTFKLHMHPEFKDASNFLYTYPSEFDIYYYQNGQENMNIHRHTSCVLTDMNISYTPQGILSTFEDGMPTQINVQLQFKELALLHKQAIADGY